MSRPPLVVEIPFGDLIALMKTVGRCAELLDAVVKHDPEVDERAAVLAARGLVCSMRDRLLRAVDGQQVRHAQSGVGARER